MEVLGYIAMFFVGLLLGTMGGGGSMLSVPVFVYFFSMDAVASSAYSLFMVGVSSLAGAALKAKQLDFRTGIIFGIPSLLVIFSLRKWLIPFLPETLIHLGGLQVTKSVFFLLLFGLVMIVASMLSIRGKVATKKGQKIRKSFFCLVVCGGLTGGLTGLLGIGGGFIIIPVLVYISGVNFSTAVGTALFIIAVNSLVGFTGDVSNFAIDWFFLLRITLLAVVGILAGNFIAERIPISRLKALFGWVTLTIGLMILILEGTSWLLVA